MLKKPIIWVMLSSSASLKSAFSDKRLNEMRVAMTEVMNKFSVHVFDLSDFVKSDCNMIHRDGIHFTPLGHRLISKHLLKFVLTLSPDIGRSLTHSHPPISNDTSGTSTAASTAARTYKRSYRNASQYDYPPNKRSFTRRTIESSHDIDYRASEAFGLAFGIAWKTFNERR